MPTSEARAGVVIVALGLAAACSPGQPSAHHVLTRVEEQRAATDDDGMVPCARGNAGLARVCSVERTSTNRGPMLTLRRPDGSFHRLLATHDGRGLVAADGAEPARVAVVGPDLIEVTVAADRYRLPATVKR